DRSDEVDITSPSLPQPVIARSAATKQPEVWDNPNPPPITPSRVILSAAKNPGKEVRSTVGGILRCAQNDSGGGVCGVEPRASRAMRFLAALGMTQRQNDAG